MLVRQGDVDGASCAEEGRKDEGGEHRCGHQAQRPLEHARQFHPGEQGDEGDPEGVGGDAHADHRQPQRRPRQRLPPKHKPTKTPTSAAPTSPRLSGNDAPSTASTPAERAAATLARSVIAGNSSASRANGMTKSSGHPSGTRAPRKTPAALLNIHTTTKQAPAPRK